MMKSTTIAAILCVVCTALHARQRVSGKITDRENGLPLEGATVSVKGKSLHSHSNRDGSYTIQVQSNDTLVFSHIGFDELFLPIKAGMENASVKLRRNALQLSQVVIADNHTLRQLSQIDLHTNPVNSAQDLLRKVPGLFIAQHAGGGKAEQIFLRGFDIDHGTDIRITADGMPVNMVSHAHGQGYADLHFLIPETIKDIDFGKGAYYADKGNFATAGYVNFSTYDHPDKSLVKMEAGQFNTLRTMAMINLLHEQTENGGRNAYIAGEYQYTNGPFDAPQHFNRVNLFAKYTQDVNERTSWGIQASAFTSKWDASGQVPDRAVKEGLIGRFGAIDPTEGGDTRRSNIAVNYRHRINEAESVQGMFYYTKYDFSLYSNFTFFLNDPVYGDQIHQQESRNIYGMEHRYTHQYFFTNSQLDFHAGLGFRNDKVNGLQLSHTYRRDSLLNRMAYGDVDETNVSGYVSTDWRIGNWLINPAVRIDHFIFNYQDKLLPTYATLAASKTQLSPKLNFAYNGGHNWQAYLKTGMGFHSNDTRVVVAQKGKDILPRTIGADLGAIFKPTPRLIIHPAVWYLHMDQEFVYVGDEAIVEPSGQTRRLGADLGLRYQPFSWLYVDGDINYTKPRALDVPKAESNIPLAPTLTSTGGVAVAIPSGFSFNLRYRYVKNRPANEDNSVVAQGYFINDLVASYTRKHWELSIQIENLFDREWREAQFDTESRLQNEVAPVSEIHYTPGTPFFAKAKLSVWF